MLGPNLFVVLRRIVLATVAPLVSMAGVVAEPMEFTGVVERILDGDTIEVRANGQLRAVRINWIDAPELEQKWGRESREALKQEVFGRQVRVVPYRDENPLPSDVFLGDLFLSEKRIKDGWAWNYAPYSNAENLIAAEKQAKAAKRGMWRDGNLQSPWEYRKAKEQIRGGSGARESQINWDDYLADCGLKAQEANEAKTEKLFREKYKGKPVSWTGVVDSVREKPLSEGFAIGVQMKPTESVLGSADVSLFADKDLQDQVLNIKRGNTIKFSGKLEAQGGHLLNHTIALDNFEIVP